MSSLYELTNDFQQIRDILYGDDADFSEEALKNSLECIAYEIEEKAEGYAKIIKEIEGDIAVLLSEEKRIQGKRYTLQNRRDFLKNNLEETMKVTGKTKFKTPLFSFNIQKNGGLQPLIIDVPAIDIPKKYRIPQAPVPDNDAIREYLKDNTVPWAHLEERGESLRIR